MHVTGGGFYENIPRVFPAGLGCDIQPGSWDCPPLFQWLQQVCLLSSLQPVLGQDLGRMALHLHPNCRVSDVCGSEDGFMLLYLGQDSVKPSCSADAC